MADLQDPKTGRFVSGNPGGPGRPQGAIGYGKELAKAFEELKKVRNIDYFEALVVKALHSDRVMIALLPYILPQLGIDRHEAPPHNFTYVEQNYIAGSGLEADGAIGTARMRIADINERADKFMRQNYSTPLREADTDTDEPENTNA